MNISAGLFLNHKLHPIYFKISKASITILSFLESIVNDSIR